MRRTQLFSTLMLTSIGALGCARDPMPTTMRESEATSGALVSSNPSTIADPFTSPIEAIEPDPVAPVAGAGTGGSMDAVPVAAQETLSDSQILRVAEVVDKGEIDQAKAIQKKAKTPAVREYAAEMLQHHLASKQKDVQTAKAEQIKPEESMVCHDLSAKAENTLQDIQSTKQTATAERVYIDAQVAQHEEVLQLIQTRLIPNAKDPALKTRLEAKREMVEKHVEQARKLQESLKSAG